MAVLTFILLIISVCTIVMSFCMTYTVSSARNSKGDFYKYDRIIEICRTIIVCSSSYQYRVRSFWFLYENTICSRRT